MIVYKCTIPLTPRTKKNSQRIKYRNGKPYIRQSEAYEQYEHDVGYYIRSPKQPLNGKYNVKCVYYVGNVKTIDLLNLLAATLDILVNAGVLKDDDSEIAFSHDGSHVVKKSKKPRTEIEISEV